MAGVLQNTDTQTRDIVSRSLQLRASTVDEESRTVEATLVTEQPTLVYDWRSGRVVDEVLRVEGADVPEQVPLLETHRSYDLDAVIGSVRDIRVEGDSVVGRLHFAEGDAAAERGWQMVRQGHLTDVSAGYRVYEDATEQIKPGETKTVDGRAYSAGLVPLFIRKRWSLREGSLVPIGADKAAKIRAEQQTETQCRRIVMSDRQKAYLVSIGLRADASETDIAAFVDGLDLAQRASYDELAQPEPKPEAQLRHEHTQRAETPDAQEMARAAVAAERERVRQIRALASDRTPADVVQRAIDEGMDADMAARAMLEAERATFQGPVSGGRSITDHEPEAAILAAGLAQRVGAPLYRRNATENQRKAAEETANKAERYSGMSMMDFCRHAIRLDGRDVPVHRDDVIRTAVSGAALTNIFTQSVDAQLMRAFDEHPDTTAGWVREVDVSTFMLQDRMALHALEGLQKLGRGGTAQHTKPTDQKESYRVARYASQFVVDEQDIIDDNLNAFYEMPMLMGRASARLRPDLVYAILMANPDLAVDSTALFHGDHGNLGANAFSSTNIKTAVAAMRKQTENSVNLNIEPRYLLVGPGNEFLARETISSAQLLIASGETAFHERGNRNVITDLGLQLRVDARIDNGVTSPDTGTTTAGDANKWFLSADPVSGRTIEVGYLAGTGRRPSVRSFVLDRGQWGIGWDIKMDIGAAPLDYRGLYCSTST